MFTEHLPVVFAMAWILAIANIIGAIQTFIFAKTLARISFVRGSILIPLILLCAVLGSFTSNSSMGDLVVTFVFGVIGYFMKMYDYSKASLVLGLILGHIAETNFQKGFVGFFPDFPCFSFETLTAGTPIF